jgi:hypothetical protein
MKASLHQEHLLIAQIATHQIAFVRLYRGKGKMRNTAVWYNDGISNVTDEMMQAGTQHNACKWLINAMLP